MKTLIVATATAITLSSAAFAGQFDGQTSSADFAAAHFAKSHSEGDGSRAVPMLTDESAIISSKGDSGAAFAAQKLANGPEDRR